MAQGFDCTVTAGAAATRRRSQPHRQAGYCQFLCAVPFCWLRLTKATSRCAGGWMIANWRRLARHCWLGFSWSWTSGFLQSFPTCGLQPPMLLGDEFASVVLFKMWLIRLNKATCLAFSVIYSILLTGKVNGKGYFYSACVRACVRACVHACMHVCIYVCIQLYMHACMHVFFKYFSRNNTPVHRSNEGTWRLQYSIVAMCAWAQPVCDQRILPYVV